MIALLAAAVHCDGRSSAAMAALLEQLRRFHVRVVPYDPVEPKERDAQLAVHLAALRAQSPESVYVGPLSPSPPALEETQ